MKLEQQHILLVSNEPWKGTWFSKHHFAQALAEKNKVYFLDPPPAWNLVHLFSTGILAEQAGAVTVLRYNNALPFSLRSSLFRNWNNGIVARRLQKFFRSRQIAKPVFWSFDPFRLQEPSQLDAFISVYHCMDNYQCRQEQIIASNASAVITVSGFLAEKLKPYNKNVFVVPHGVPASILENKAVTLKEQFILGGTIDERTDFELLLKITEKYPAVTLKLAGPVRKEHMTMHDLGLLSQLQGLTNVIFAGDLPFEAYIDEVRASKLCLCAYKQNTESNRLSSLKIMQYLAAGKPVVSTYLAGYDNEHSRPLVALSGSHDEFLNNAVRVLAADSPQAADARKNYAAGFTYNRLLTNIEDHLNSL